MIRKAQKLILAIALLVGAVHSQAQTAVATAGGEAGTMSYTVGQPFVEPTISDAGSFTLGVQQAYQIAVVEVGVPEFATALTLEAAVYPNPVTDRLTLCVSDIESFTLRYTLTDANGRVLAAADIAKAHIAIEMGGFVQGVYFLRVTEGETLVKTFKIVKK